MGDKSPPPVYGNPQSTSQTQQGYNVNAAAAGQAASNVNQETPFGSLNYKQTGTGPNGIPLWTATTNLSPQMQAIVQSLQGGVTNQLGQGGYATNNPSDVVGSATSGATKELLGNEVSYLKPFFTQQQEQLDTQLRNQGIGPESPAYTRAMNNLSQSQNQSVTGFLAQAEPAAYQQSVSSYMLPLGVSSAEMGLLNPNMVTGSLVNPPQASVAPPNYSADVANYNQALNTQYQNQVAQNTAMMSGLFGIPTAVLGGWGASPAGGAALTAAMGMV